MRNTFLGRKLVKNFPRFHKWLENRLSTKSFTGLPLTAIVLVFVLNLLLLFEVIEDVSKTNAIIKADVITFKVLTPFRTPFFLRFFHVVTQLGESYFVFPLVVLLVIFLLLKHKRNFATGLVISTLGGFLTSLSGKHYFHRIRPDIFKDILAPVSFSFPSGHATTSVALYGFLTYLVLKHSPRNKKWIIIAAGLLIILLTGFSRIFLGVHFLSDVLAGYLVGALWLLLSISLLEFLNHRRHKKV